MPNEGLDVYVVVDMGSPAPREGFADEDELELHAEPPAVRGRREQRVDPQEFQERWNDIVALVEDMFEPEGGKQTKRLQLDSITAQLTMSGTGKLAFLAEASASASITATFKRKA